MSRSQAARADFLPQDPSCSKYGVMAHLSVRGLVAWGLLALSVGSGCAGPTQPSALAPVVARELELSLITPQGERQADGRNSVLAKARAYLAGAPLVAGGLHFSNDPVGFVRAAFWSAGIDLFDTSVALDPEADGMEILFRSASRHGLLHHEQPHVGDLVFFDADSHQDNSYPAQVAVVESIGADGTIIAIGHFASGVRRVRLNLRQTSSSSANSVLAAKQPQPAAALFRSFADPFRS